MPPLLRSLRLRRLGQFLEPFTSLSPAARLIRRSARQQWRLLTVNIATNLLSSISEGATLGVIFLAVSLISSPNPEQWSRIPVVAQAIRLPVLGNALQGVINSSSGQGILFVLLIGFALVLQVIVALTMYFNSVSAGIIGNRLSAQISSLLHRRTLSFSFSCACRFRVGDLLNYIQTGGNAVSTQISLTNTLLTNLIQLLVYLVILIAISPWLLLVAACMAAFMGAIQKQILPRLRHTSEVMTMVGVEMSSRVTENIQGLRLIHSSGELDKASQSLDGLFHQWLRHADRLSFITNLITPISSILPIAAVTIISILSLILFHDRQSGVIPSLVTFVLALQRMNSRLNTVNTIAVGYANNSAIVDRLNSILQDSDKQFVRTGGSPYSKFEREIRLEKVTLRYGPDLEASLSSIDLVIPKGHTVALIGSSGAGKSSVADLLVGLYEPTEGFIQIDGQSLSEIDLASWQQRIGVVSQDTFLMNTTIAGNIAYGRASATREQIEAAATSAHAVGFIHDLPEGFDTLIGERGYRLSGGQRQRISLARAILRNPDLLILDEATSALDTQSERLVQQAIERFEGQKTVLVIAHRLSTIVGADLICVMDRGRIIERGRHEELIAANGPYTQLWQLQAGEALVGKRD